MGVRLKCDGAEVGGRKTKKKSNDCQMEMHKSEKREHSLFFTILKQYSESHIAIIFTLLSRNKCYIYFKDKIKWERYKRSHNNKEKHESWGLYYPAMGNE